MPGEVIEWAGVKLDKPSLELIYRGQHIHLRPTEVAIMALLLERQGKLVSYAMIEDIVYPHDDLPLGFDIMNNVGQHTYNLRKKTGLAIYGLAGQGILMLEPD